MTSIKDVKPKVEPKIHSLYKNPKKKNSVQLGALLGVKEKEKKSIFLEQPSNNLLKSPTPSRFKERLSKSPLKSPQRDSPSRSFFAAPLDVNYMENDPLLM